MLVALLSTTVLLAPEIQGLVRLTKLVLKCWIIQDFDS